MTIRSFSLRSADEFEPEVVAAAAVEILGAVRGKQFGRLADGREVQVQAQRQPWEAGNGLQPNQLLVQRVERVKRRDRPFPQERVVRFVARIVEPGSYQAAVERERAAAAERERRNKPVRRRADALGHLSLLARKQPNPGVLRSTGVLAPYTAIGSTDTTQQVQGAAAILAVLAGKGVTLQLDPGGHYLVPTSKRGALSGEAREVLREAEPLLRAHLAGEPLRCALDHGRTAAPEAVTLLEGGAPCCAEHLGEELPE